MHDLAAKGLTRLADPDLLTYYRLRQRMVDSSESACQCAWDPSGCSREQMSAGMYVLSDDEVRTWAKLLLKAARLQRETPAAIPDRREEYDAGVRRILEKLPKDVQDRFWEVAEGKSASAADKCFAIRTVFHGVEALPEAERAALVRAYLTPDPPG